MVKTIIAFSFLIFGTHSYANNCTYGAPDTCPKGSYCIKLDKNKAECREEFKKDLLNISLPFKSKTKVWCDQGPLSPKENSHTWLNTAFALDLKSSEPKKSIEVIASIPGTIIAFDKCKTKNDHCGLGFGNQVKIMTNDGYVLFYAHLEKVFVKTGQKVKVGDILGIEGMTGWTGKDNRHLHLSLHYDWRPSGFDYWKQVGFLPDSIPYSLSFCEVECGPGCKTRKLDIRKLSCRRTAKETKPICK